MPAINDPLERLSRWLTGVAFVAAVVVAVAAPLLATEWRNRPYAGFFVDPNLIVSNSGRFITTGPVADLRHPLRVTQVSGDQVTTPTEYDRALARHGLGASVTIFTEDRSGASRIFHPVPLIAYPGDALLRQFWLPFLIGLAYLLIGLWVYGLQGHTRPGRALAFFCACTAIVILLSFDINTTHTGVSLWTLAMALEGGTLISLALRFPKEWPTVSHRPWLLAGPYLAALALGLWGVWSYSHADPWAQVDARHAIYGFAALGVAFFLFTSAYRATRGHTGLVRRQARIVLVGSLLAFTPVTIWFVLPLLGIQVPFTPVVLLPSLVIFPFAVAVAIVRYRLWQIDTLVNHTVVYGALTAVLAGLYSASIGLSQKLFVAFTGERSDAAIVLTTLVVASGFTTLKTRLQLLVDRHFGDGRKELTPLLEFGDAVRSWAELSDPYQVARRTLAEAVSGLGAEGGVLRVVGDDGDATVFVHGPWRGRIAASMPIVSGDQTLGVLQVGPRSNGKPYGQAEIETAADVVSEIAPVLRRAARPSGVRPLQPASGSQTEESQPADPVGEAAQRLQPGVNSGRARQQTLTG